MTKKYITIKGCRVHNLKDVSIKIPRNQFVVITGLSGSGKSSLAFDTIYAEGQRRYVESLSSYARQFLDIMDKPDVDSVEGLSPVIAIDQKSTITNPRSTIGTITEVYDLLRLMYSKIGIPHCPTCNKEVHQQDADQIVSHTFNKLIGKKVRILSPVKRKQKEKYKRLIKNIKHADFFQVRCDGVVYDIDDIAKMKFDEKNNHAIEVVIDSFTLENSKPMKKRLQEVINQALDLSNGTVIISANGNHKNDLIFHERLYCSSCEVELPEIELRSFSFNNPYGACEKCSGLGTNLEIDSALLMPNSKLTIAQGAIRIWSKIFANQPWYNELLEQVAENHGFSAHIEASKLKKKDLNILWYGDQQFYYIGNREIVFEGIIPILEARYRETDSEYVQKEIEKYMRVLVCPDCKGKRLRPEFLAVTVGEYSISDITLLSIEKMSELLGDLLKQLSKDKDTQRNKKIGEPIVREIQKRIAHLEEVGLSYLTLDRSAATLSGGEAQRIRLAKQLSSNLSEVIYVLDEPSIGLHSRDNDKLIKTLKRLRDLDNTVIVVEHDAAIIQEADFVVDVGPGAGMYGGEIIAAGTPQDIRKSSKSLTGKYLSGELTIPSPKVRRQGSNKKITIKGATAFNLKNVTAEIPLGMLTCVTGVSGSGKSSLIIDILSKYLNQLFYRSKAQPAEYKSIKGVEAIDKVISIDQSPIGRTPRSNPATYTGVFTHIRDLFTEVPEAKLHGFDAGKFSFNVKGGRCEACSGDGLVKIEMQFLPDVYVECSECHGHRYREEVLEVYYKQKNISDVLNMTVREALDFFRDVPNIQTKLYTLDEVGLGYVKLGQSATTLSGGEAQRVKLATELSRRSTGKTLYILDEPTTGLHFEDIKRLLTILHKLVDKGNSVLIIEHNLDVIKSADWVIDLGPDGGDKGGEIVVAGTPEDVAKEKKSLTGKFLKEVL